MSRQAKPITHLLVTDYDGYAKGVLSLTQPDEISVADMLKLKRLICSSEFVESAVEKYMKELVITPEILKLKDGSCTFDYRTNACIYAPATLTAIDVY